MKYAIFIQDSAHEDIADAYTYLRREMGARANSWLERLRAMIETLSEMPQRCAIAPENRHFPEEIRQLKFESYRVLFRIENDEVIVLHVRHHARDTLKP